VTILTAGDPGAFAAVVTRLREGRPVVVPTDTVYGIAALVDGVERLRDLKHRPASRAIPLLVGGPADLDGLAAEPSAAERALADAFWPGPLTIVVVARPSPLRAMVSDDDTVGVRCPAASLVRSIAAEVGPLPTTSANLHGEPTPVDAAGVAAALGDPDLLVVDGGHLSGGASTVVRVLAGPSPSVEILREGPIDAARVQAVVAAAGS
jgi:L-threonylcarbamoyladenylate synthase